jgi:hypothetical protein
MSDASLSLRHRIINAAMRTVYFGRVPRARPQHEPTAPAAGVGIIPPPRRPPTSGAGNPTQRPRLIIASHRNGAIDGHQVLAAFPHVPVPRLHPARPPLVPSAVHRRIPVVRPKDVDRYGLDPASVASPVEAGLAHLRRGGDLGIFPEASSEWGYRPQPYKSGAARIACTLIDEGTDVEVIPVGLFYSTPDRFRSRAEVVGGPAVTIPGRNAGIGRNGSPRSPR